MAPIGPRRPGEMTPDPDCHLPMSPAPFRMVAQSATTRIDGHFVTAESALDHLMEMGAGSYHVTIWTPEGRVALSVHGSLLRRLEA